jgi:hypothetical protein
MVSAGPELHLGVVLLGLHSVASGRGACHAKTRHQKGLRLCPAGDGSVQLDHTVGQRDPLRFRHRVEIRPRIRLGKLVVFQRKRHIGKLSMISVI